MKQLTLLFTVILLSLSLPAMSNECSRKEWVKDHRTQGGGWIWFPGRYSSRSEGIATSMAKGMAIEALMAECEMPHKEVKFHETCVERVGYDYQVYVRASITAKQCAEMKTKYGKRNQTHSGLLALRNNYKSTLSGLEVDSRKCNRWNYKGCFNEAVKRSDLGETALAREYVRISCDEGHMTSCAWFGYMSWKLGDLEVAEKYMKYSCREGSGTGCTMLKTLSGTGQ